MISYLSLPKPISITFSKSPITYFNLNIKNLFHISTKTLILQEKLWLHTFRFPRLPLKKQVLYSSALSIIHEPLIWFIKRIRLIKRVHTLNHSFIPWRISLRPISHLSSNHSSVRTTCNLLTCLSLTDFPFNPNGLLSNSHNKALLVWIYVCEIQLNPHLTNTHVCTQYTRKPCAVMPV